MLVDISKGELIDKITILEIKNEKIDDVEKLKLMNVNRELWDVEDDLRALEKLGKFDDAFIEKARSVYKLNDERSRLKRIINVDEGSDIVEEKSH